MLTQANKRWLTSSKAHSPSELQAFRAAYLFTELKDMLHHWELTLDDALADDALPVDVALASADAATAAFDITSGNGAALRFRVPSAGFMLVWSVSPNSPARALLAMSAGAGRGLRSSASAGDAMIQLGSAPRGVPESFLVERGVCGGGVTDAVMEGGSAVASRRSTGELVQLGRDRGHRGRRSSGTSWAPSLKRPRQGMTA